MGLQQKSVEYHDPAMEQTHATPPYPLGPATTSEGTNFSVFSASATRMELVLFDHAGDSAPSQVIALDPVLHRTSHYWHIFLPGVKPGQLYGYRADGPNDPANGQRFDSQKVLIDPYGKSVSVGPKYDRAAACKPGDNAATCMKSVLADLSIFDWEGDAPLYRPFRRSVIYEMHVAGFTRHPNSGVTPANRGTYLGVIEEDELHSSGTCRKHTKVCSFGCGCRAERIRRGDMCLLNGRIVKLDGLLI